MIRERSNPEGALGITRSAISLHMSDLEKRLGMRLCQRAITRLAAHEDTLLFQRRFSSVMQPSLTAKMSIR